MPGAFLIVLFKCCFTYHGEYTYNQSRLIHNYEKIEDEVIDKKRGREKKAKIISVSFSMNQGYDSTTVSFEKNNENSEKLKNGTKQL